MSRRLADDSSLLALRLTRELQCRGAAPMTTKERVEIYGQVPYGATKSDEDGALAALAPGAESGRLEAQPGGGCAFVESRVGCESLRLRRHDVPMLGRTFRCVHGNPDSVRRGTTGLSAGCHESGDGSGLVLGSQVRVAQGHLDVGVTEELAHRIQIDSCHHQL